MHTNPEVLALVALGEQEAASSEDLDHIAHCPSCERELSELGHLSQVSRTISDHFTLETPSPAVWNRIRDQLGFGSEFSSDLVPPVVGLEAGDRPAAAPQSSATATAPESPATAAAPESPATAAAPESPATRPLVAVPSPADEPAETPERLDRPTPSRRRVLSLALAAGLALLAGIGGTLAWQQFTSNDTVISSAPLEPLPAWSGAAGVATLEEDAAGNKILVITMETPRPVDGIQQVWLADSTATKMTPIGPLSQPGQRFVLPEDLDVSRFPLIDISVQQPGGDPAHSGNSIVRGTLPV
jgi:hypothetical protein